jgi:hypothetical protein
MTPNQTTGSRLASSGSPKFFRKCASHRRSKPSLDVVLGDRGPASAHDHQTPGTVTIEGAKELQTGPKVGDR